MKKESSIKLKYAIRDLFIEFQSKLQFFERKFLKEYGIADVTPNELKVLYIIAMSNLKSMSEIAEKLHVTQGTLSTTVNCLERKGYLIKAKQEHDRRFVAISLTEKSAKVIEYYGLFHYELIENLINRLLDQDSIVVKDILLNLNNIVESNFYKKRLKR